MLAHMTVLTKASDTAIERCLGQIRPVLSDPGLARRLYREQDRSSFGSRVVALRKELGWSRRRLVRECQQTARRLGLGVRP